MPSKGAARWLESVWYEGRWGASLLLPLSGLFRLVTALRRSLYRWGWRRVGVVDCPVVIVGNLVAGGSGKTPLVGWLATTLRDAGEQPAIVSRGYGGRQVNEAQLVQADSDACDVGDEPLMLCRQTGVPVVVARDRHAAAALALANGATIVIADDGLQHYALHRDAEIVVVDAARRHGNGHCLPAGPLREPVSRLEDVDLVVHAGDGPAPNYALRTGEAVNAVTGERRPLADFSGQLVYALAGIGHPDRFYAALKSAGIDVRPVEATDHGRVSAAALDPDGDGAVLMTAKDAVKYAALNTRHWVVEATVSIDEASRRAIMSTIDHARARFEARTGAS